MLGQSSQLGSEESLSFQCTLHAPVSRMAFLLNQLLVTDTNLLHELVKEFLELRSHRQSYFASTALGISWRLSLYV